MPETTATVTAARYCDAEVFRATHIDPAEYCENDALDGSDFCALHTEGEVDPDDLRDAWLEDNYYEKNGF